MAFKNSPCFILFKPILLSLSILFLLQCGKQLQESEEATSTAIMQDDIEEDQEKKKQQKGPSGIDDLIWYKYTFLVEDEDFLLSDDLKVALGMQSQESEDSSVLDSLMSSAAKAVGIEACEYTITATDPNGEPIPQEDIINPRGIDYRTDGEILENERGFTFEHSMNLSITGMTFTGNCPGFDPQLLQITKETETQEAKHFFFQRKSESELTFGLVDLIVYSPEKLTILETIEFSQAEQVFEEGTIKQECSSLSIFHNSKEQAKLCMKETSTDGYYQVLSVPADFKVSLKDGYTLKLNQLAEFPPISNLLIKMQDLMKLAFM